MKGILSFARKYEAGKSSIFSWSQAVTDSTDSLQEFSQRFSRLHVQALQFLDRIKTIGFNSAMEEYDRRKLSVFNQLNFLQFVAGLVTPVSSLLFLDKFPVNLFLICSIPPLISLVVLFLNYYFKHEAGLIFYFCFYPLATGIVHLHGIHLGTELSFILYGILSVFFLHSIAQMLFALSLSMISYVVLAIAGRSLIAPVEGLNAGLYLFNQTTCIGLIFYVLYLVKKENAIYQKGILINYHSIQEKTREIQWQKSEIERKAAILNKQTQELTALNGQKSMLFSIIAHDLKLPIYALRNLFVQMQDHRQARSIIQNALPDIVENLNATTSLMENLLFWAKAQMESTRVVKASFCMADLVEEAVKVQRLQSESKNLLIVVDLPSTGWVFADREMISLVVRNLLSNAIKFTPAHGTILVSAFREADRLITKIQDNGVGIETEALEKIARSEFFSSRGTASESGTGLGLLLCKDFLARNAGDLKISSSKGKGTTISCELPLAAAS